MIAAGLMGESIVAAMPSPSSSLESGGGMRGPPLTSAAAMDVIDRLSEEEWDFVGAA